MLKPVHIMSTSQFNSYENKLKLHPVKGYEYFRWFITFPISMQSREVNSIF